MWAQRNSRVRAWAFVQRAILNCNNDIRDRFDDMAAPAKRSPATRLLGPIGVVAGVALAGWWLMAPDVETVDTERAQTGLSAESPAKESGGAETIIPAQPDRTVGIAALALSRDGRHIAGAGRDGSVRVWDRDGAQIEIADAHQGLPATAVEFLADGNVVTGGMDSEVRVWSVGDRIAGVNVLRAHEHGVSALSVSPSGELLASAGQETRIMLWDAVTGRLRNILSGHTDFIGDIVFNGDGSRLASAGDDGLVLVWDVASGQVAQTLRAHTAAVNEVQFTPDGRSLVSAGEDGKIIVWDLRSGLPLREIVGRQGPVSAIALSADGKLLASTGRYNDVLLWDHYAGTQVASIDTGAFVDAV
jgi:WD40 repeat protein